MADINLNIFDQLAKKKQDALLAMFADRHVTIAACGDVFKNTISTLRDRGWKTHEPIWNAALFLNTVSYDLSIGIIDLVYERDLWKRRLIARLMALLLFEIGEDIPTVFGKNFRAAAKALNVPEEHIAAVGAETKKFSVFWNENRSLLKEIRTVAAAHREHDAIALHESINGIDLFKLIGLAVTVGGLANSLGSANQRILTSSSTTKPPEQK